MINSVNPFISAYTNAAKDLLLPDDLEPFLLKLQLGQFGFGGELPTRGLIQADDVLLGDLGLAVEAAIPQPVDVGLTVGISS